MAKIDCFQDVGGDHFEVYAKLRRGVYSPSGSRTKPWEGVQEGKAPGKLMDMSKFDDIENSFSEPLYTDIML